MLLSIKLKNMIKKENKDKDLVFHLKNININGAKRGCSGFIQNLSNEKIVYVNTEDINYSSLAKKNLYRTANSLKDFTGGRNQYAEDDSIAKRILELL